MILFPPHLINLHLIIMHNFKWENSFSASVTLTVRRMIALKSNKELDLQSPFSS